MNRKHFIILTCVLILCFLSFSTSSILSVRVPDVFAAEGYIVSGSGYNYPGSNASEMLEVNIISSSLNDSWLRYYNPGMNLVSASITNAVVENHTLTITGSAIVQGYSNFTFTATIINGKPDSWGLEIYNPDGYLYFQRDVQNIAKGDFVISVVSKLTNNDH